MGAVSAALAFCVSKKTTEDRASQEEQNGANFSSIAPSSDELWVRKDKPGLGIIFCVSVTPHWKVLRS